MAKIQCPHCKAINQDVDLTDPCWQCGTILGAPASALESGAGPPTSEVNPSIATTTTVPVAPAQTTIERDARPDDVPTPQRLHHPSSSYAVWAIGTTLVALIAIVIWFFLFRVHH